MDTSATHKKFWISDDRQGELGAWPIDTPDDTIWAELERDCGQSRAQMGGQIKSGAWSDGVNQ